MSWNFKKFWKQSFDFVVMCIGTCMSVAQKKKINALFELMKTFTESQRLSDSFEKITVKIRLIHCKH